MNNPYSELIEKIHEGSETHIHLHCFLVQKQLQLQRQISHLLIALLVSIWLIFILQPMSGKAESKTTPTPPSIEWDQRPAELPRTVPAYRHFQALT
jgi:hypothetical protein